jgi:hypothetical protein
MPYFCGLYLFVYSVFNPSLPLPIKMLPKTLIVSFYGMAALSLYIYRPPPLPGETRVVYVVLQFCNDMMLFYLPKSHHCRMPRLRSRCPSQKVRHKYSTYVYHFPPTSCQEKSMMDTTPTCLVALLIIVSGQSALRVKVVAVSSQ